MVIIYFFDDTQTLLKIETNALSIIQTQELNDDGLLEDSLSVSIPNDEKLLGAQYMAVKSHEGNAQAFDMYRIIDSRTSGEITYFTGIQLAYYELAGYVVEDLRPTDRGVSYVAEQLLADTEWRVGYVDDLPNITTNFYYLSAKDAFVKLQSVAGCEVIFKVEISGQGVTDKWVEIYDQLGDITRKRFTYGDSALDVVREINHNGIYTALIGQGKGEESGDGYGRKITFEDVEWSIANGDPVDKPLGQKYVELPNMTAEYGIPVTGGKRPRITAAEFDTDDPAALLALTYQALVNIARPKVLFKANVVNIGGGNIGDTVTIHRYDLGIHYETRLRRVERDKLNENRTQVQVGDMVHQSSTRKTNNVIRNVSNRIDEVETNIVNYVGVTADGKNAITWGNDEPEQARTGDLWYRDHPSINGEKQMLIWNGTSWEISLDTSRQSEAEQAIIDAQATADAAKDEAETASGRVQTAIDNAADAYEYADSAIRAANGKNTVYRGDQQPTEGKENDIWFQSIVENGEEATKMYVHDGSAWVLRAHDASDLAGTLDLSQLNVINLNMDSATGGSLHLDRGLKVTNNDKDVLKVENGNVVMDVDNLLIQSQGLDEVMSTSFYQDGLAVGMMYEENGEIKSIFNLGANGPYLSGDNIVLDGDTIVNGTFTVTDEIFAENMSIDKFTAGTLNAANVNLINVNVSSLVGNTSEFIRSGWNAVNSRADINGSRLRFTHNDGTATEIGASGIRRVTPSDNRAYHYLIYATTFIRGVSSSSAHWIQLPDDFKGKDFKVYLAVADSMNALNYKRAIQRFVCTIHPGHSIDYARARVPIIGYKSETLSDGKAPEITSVQGLLWAIY